MAKTNKNFDRVIVQNASRKDSKFDLTHSYASTSDFGQVQPLQCLKMIPHSHQICKTKSVVRLAPMTLPTTSGRISYKVWHKFVGMSDLLRNFGSFLTGESYGAPSGLVKMTALPRMTLAELSAFCLVGCSVTCYHLNVGDDPTAITNDWWTHDIASNDQIAWRTWLNNAINSLYGHYVMATPATAQVNNFDGLTYSGLNWLYIKVLNDRFSDVLFPIANISPTNSRYDAIWPANTANGVNQVDIRHCDKVFERTFTYNGQTDTFAFAVNFSSYGAQWAKILHGLGYGVDFESGRSVDLMRLFALYKAYYDSFGISLYTNYEQTYCNRILRYYENVPSTVFTLLSNTPNDMFYHFVHDLVGMYVTDDVDYVGAHRLTDVTSSGSSELGFVQNIVVASPNVVTPPGAFNQGAAPDVQPSAVSRSTNAVYINQVSHTQVDAELLKILYKSINRQTVAGKRIAELLRAGGYGSYVDEMKSSFIGQCTVDIDVTDVNATADSTNSATGSDTTLGEYAGKGVGFNNEWEKDVFEYETDEFGYWITLASVVPESSYVQGCDMTIYDVDRYQQYQQEYDAVGYEIQNKNVVVSGVDWNDGSLIDSKSDDPFGVVPRLTRYKVTRDLLSGDFRRRSVRDSISGFSLNKWLAVGDADASGVPIPNQSNDGMGYPLTKEMQLVDLPVAGPAWRYINRYPWLANFERIFNYFGLNRYTSTSVGALAWFFCNHDFADNFYLFGIFYNDYWAPMLPIEDSWSTTEDNDGKGTPMRQA